MKHSHLPRQARDRHKKKPLKPTQAGRFRRTGLICWRCTASILRQSATKRSNAPTGLRRSLCAPVRAVTPWFGHQFRTGKQRSYHLPRQARDERKETLRKTACVSSSSSGKVRHLGFSTHARTTQIVVSKNGLFEPFIYIMHHLTKTGSGRT